MHLQHDLNHAAYTLSTLKMTVNANIIPQSSSMYLERTNIST